MLALWCSCKRIRLTVVFEGSNLAQLCMQVVGETCQSDCSALIGEKRRFSYP